MKTLAALVLLATASAFTATIVTAKTSANVYPNEIRRVYERPLFKLEKGEVVEVVKWGTPLTKIRNRRGRYGWVEPATLDSLKRPPILNLVVDSETTGQIPETANQDAGRAGSDSTKISK